MSRSPFKIHIQSLPTTSLAPTSSSPNQFLPDLPAPPWITAPPNPPQPPPCPNLFPPWQPEGTCEHPSLIPFFHCWWPPHQEAMCLWNTSVKCFIWSQAQPHCPALFSQGKLGPHWDKPPRPQLKFLGKSRSCHVPPDSNSQLASPLPQACGPVSAGPWLWACLIPGHTPRYSLLFSLLHPHQASRASCSSAQTCFMHAPGLPWSFIHGAAAPMAYLWALTSSCTLDGVPRTCHACVLSPSSLVMGSTILCPLQSVA